jgi:hypothetical protein
LIGSRPFTALTLPISVSLPVSFVVIGGNCRMIGAVPIAL